MTISATNHKYPFQHHCNPPCSNLDGNVPVEIAIPQSLEPQADSIEKEQKSSTPPDREIELEQNLGINMS